LGFAVLDWVDVAEAEVAEAEVAEAEVTEAEVAETEVWFSVAARGGP